MQTVSWLWTPVHSQMQWYVVGRLLRWPQQLRQAAHLRTGEIVSFLAQVASFEFAGVVMAFVTRFCATVSMLAVCR